MSETNKSILVIDTPESCEECILYTGYSCHAYVKPIHCKHKPNWCPLSPLPPQLDLTRYNIRGDAKSITHMMMCIHDLGWNDFRDKILEGNNDSTRLNK